MGREVRAAPAYLLAFGCAGGRGSRTAPNACELAALRAVCEPRGVTPFAEERSDRADDGPGPLFPRGVPLPSCSWLARSSAGISGWPSAPSYAPEACEYIFRLSARPPRRTGGGDEGDHPPPTPRSWAVPAAPTLGRRRPLSS